jgi:hypothetical protein
MIVNALATGLIVFKILKVYREIRPTSDERTLGNSSGSKYRSVVLVIIESGMVLFCVQLVRVVLAINFEMTGSDVSSNVLQIVIAIQEILNVSTTINIGCCYFLMTWVWVGHNTYHHLSAGLNGIVFLRRRFDDRIYR